MVQLMTLTETQAFEVKLDKNYLMVEVIPTKTEDLADKIQIYTCQQLKYNDLGSIGKLQNKMEELHLLDEKLCDYADQRIALDLDGGVQVNYGKIGDLLDNFKGITEAITPMAATLIFNIINLSIYS